MLIHFMSLLDPVLFDPNQVAERLNRFLLHVLVGEISSSITRGETFPVSVLLPRPARTRPLRDTLVRFKRHVRRIVGTAYDLY